MSLSLIELNVNSTYESILNNQPDGQIRGYLIDGGLDKKLAPIIKLASKIEKVINSAVFHAVKVSFGSRSKRVEIVFKIDKKIYFVKISTPQKCDSAALELEQTIRSCMLTGQKTELGGLVFVEGDLSEFNTDSFTKTHTNHVIINPMSVDLHRMLNGVSDKPSSSRKNPVPS